MPGKSALALAADAADKALADVRQLGDLVVAAFFEREKPKERQTRLAVYWGLTQDWVDGSGPLPEPYGGRQARVTFHWHIEFPEVFTGQGQGFDAFLGNPPFLGGKRISTVLGDSFRDWLATAHEEASSKVKLSRLKISGLKLSVAKPRKLIR